jgi:hypothetical protein
MIFGAGKLLPLMRWRTQSCETVSQGPNPANRDENRKNERRTYASVFAYGRRRKHRATNG